MAPSALGSRDAADTKTGGKSATASSLLKYLGSEGKMTMLISFLVGSLTIASGVCAIFLVVSAFRNNLLQGLLCLFLPLYLAYWAFARFEHPQRRPLLWTLFGGPIFAAALWGVFLFSKMG